MISTSLKPIWNNFFNLGVFQAAGMLLQLIAIPLITKNYGLVVFGEVALASSIGIFLANLVNYGTNQTAVKDISVQRSNTQKLSQIVSEIFYVRSVVFVAVVIIISIITITTQPEHLLLFLSILPLIASEIFNPLYFLVGIEKIHLISWGNLLARAISLCLILFISLHQNIPEYLNLMLSLPTLIYFVATFFFIKSKFQLSISIFSFTHLKGNLKHNFYVTLNGSSVILQQSIFMFTAAGVVGAKTLGAYGIIDKLLGAVRQLVSSFSSAIYPRAAQLFNNGEQEWERFRKKIQTGYTIFFIITALLIILVASHMSKIFVEQDDSLLILFFNYFSLAPLALALNANNVLEMLLKKQYKQMFNISVLIILMTAVISFFLTRFFNESALGLYPLIIESTCLLIYTAFLLFHKSNA